MTQWHWLITDTKCKLKPHWATQQQIW